MGFGWLRALRSATLARTSALLMTAVLLAGTVFVAPVAAVPLADATPPSVPAAEPDPADEPVVLDPADEVPDLRTATSRTYDLGDGRYAVEAFADPIFHQPEGSETFAIVEERVAGVLDRSYLVDESGSVLQVDIASGAGVGRYLVTYNGHGDAMALWKVDPLTGGLTLANSFTYATWGAPSVATHNGAPDLGFRFRYVGEFDVQWDGELGLGLLYMHARHYAPGIGRFLQPDPDRSEANLYSYAANNPVTEIDPDGTCFILCVVVVGVLLFGALEAGSEVTRYALTTPQQQWTGEGFRDAAAWGAVTGGVTGVIPGAGRVVGRAGAKILAKIPRASRAAAKTVSRIARPSATARAHAVRRDLSDPRSLRGARLAEVRRLIPPDWGKSVTKNGRGVRYTKPGSHGAYQVRIQRGWSKDPNPEKRGRYIRINWGGPPSDPIPLWRR